MKARRTVTPEAHNEVSVRALEAHIRQEYEQRRAALLARAQSEAAWIVSAARRRAAALLRDARRRERRQAWAAIADERPRCQARLRRRRLAERRKWAEAGFRLLEPALADLWAAGPAVRAAWLGQALGDAARSLPAGSQWLIEYPAGEPPGRLREWLAGGAAGQRCEIEAHGSLPAGYRIRAGLALIDTTPAGLTARRNAIAGRLLAELERDTGQAVE